MREPVMHHLVFLLLLLVTAVLLPGTPSASSDADELLQAAQSEFEAGAYSTALSILKTILTQNRNDTEAHYWLGRCYYELRDYDNAIAHAKRSVQLARHNSLYRQWLGRAYGCKAGRERSLLLALKAQREFEKAVTLDPFNISARRDLQEFYMEAPWILDGRDKAREMVDAIAALDVVQGQLARAEFYLKDRKPDLAEDECLLVLGARPDRVEPYLEIAEFYLSQKNGSAMKRTIQDAAEVNPSDPRLAYYRGVARVITGDEPEVAEEYLKSYLADTPQRSGWPSHAAAHEWLGRLYEQAGRRAEAAEQYRAALQIEPRRKNVRVRLENLEKPSP